jgi:hypothetical protein
MRYEMPGSDTSAVEVTNVSKHGLWILVHDNEFFLPFETFPWFRNASIDRLLHVELPTEDHLYWPDLDVDLEVESLVHPERYPLLSRVSDLDETYTSGASAVFDEPGG